MRFGLSRSAPKLLVIILLLLHPAMSASGSSGISVNGSLTFIKNTGQYHGEVKFAVHGPDASVFFDRSAISFCLKSGADALRLEFPGSSRSCSVEALDRSTAVANYIIGKDARKWHTRVPAYNSIVYHNLWDGIDMVFNGGSGRLKYDIRVHPGSSPDVIRLRYSNATSLSLNNKWELVVNTSAGSFTERVPAVYQTQNGKSKRLDGGYRLLDRNTVSFYVKGWNGRSELVIDPEIDLAWSVLFGGWSNFESAGAMTIGPDGSIYIAGETASFDFPVTPGAADNTYDDDYRDAFVMKFDAAGQPIYCTFLGGSGAYTRDEAHAIAVDQSGCAYVAGFTNCANFPTTPGAFNTNYNDKWEQGGDAFVTKLTEDGTGMYYSTLLGGSNGWNGECAYAIAVDYWGCAYVAGSTESSDFPTTYGAFDTDLSGYNKDGFITKIDPYGSYLIYSTYIGGSNGYDCINSIAVDDMGYVYAGGQTRASDFPVTPGAWDVGMGGSGDGFILKLNPDGWGLEYATFVGGSGANDAVFSICIDMLGSVYAVGITDSEDFPTTSFAYDTTHNGDDDAFLVKLGPSGTAPDFSTLLGGDDDDHAISVAVDPGGCAYVVGSTRSHDFPVTPGSYDDDMSGKQDAFIAKFAANGSGLIYATFLGGSDWDEASAVAIHDTGSVYIAGYTDSNNFPTSRVIPGPSRNSRDLFLCSLGASAVLVIGSSPGGATNPPPGGYIYPPGTVVPLSAQASTGYYFGRWEGPVADSGSRNTSVTIDVSKYVVPIFISTSDRLGVIDRLPDGAWVVVPTKPVTVEVDDGFYIQETDRSAGVKVLWPTPVSDGAAVVYGMVTTIGPERVIKAAIAIAGGQLLALPVGMTNKLIGGYLPYPLNAGFTDPAGTASLYNLGLLVRTMGQVTYIDPFGEFAYIDDGSGLKDANNLGSDGSPVSGVRLDLPDGVRVPDVGHFVAATGVSSWSSVNDVPARTLMVRSRSDISLLSGGLITGKITDKSYSTLYQTIQSTHPYAENSNVSWTINGPPNTSKMRVHFTKLELEGGFDILNLYNNMNLNILAYSYGPFYDFWSDWVTGDSIKLTLLSDRGIELYGFTIDMYEAEVLTPVPGVTVTLTPGSRTAQTGPDGIFSFSGLGAGNYRITPFMNGFTFSPAYSAVTMVGGEYMPDIDFIRN